MNERIQQLAIEVDAWCDQNCLDTYDYNKQWEIKFAELIVRECMSCAQFVGITNDRIGLGPMPIRYTSMVNDQIKKHFGVK